MPDDPDSDNWNDYVMNGEKITRHDDMLVFKKSVKFVTLRGDSLKMMTDFIFNTTDSPDAKLIITFMDEMHFDTQARAKSMGDRIIKNLL